MKHALAILLAWLMGALPAAAETVSHVEASLTFGGATVKLDHVLIVRQGNEEGMGDGPELRIFLSDREIPPAQAGAATTSGAKQYLHSGKFNGVLIVADPQGAKPSGEVTLLNAPGFEEGHFATSTSTDAFSKLAVAGGRASGIVTFASDDLKVAATFDAPVMDNPVTSDLKGASALASAPAQAMLACTRALHLGDMAAMSKVYTPARIEALNAYKAQAGEAAFREALKSDPDAAAVARTLKRVIVRGPNASVMLSDGTVAEMVLETDGWRCD
jgi:hypothetical protein